LAWRIDFDAEAIADLKQLDKPVQKRILKYLRERIATGENPRRFGGPLGHDLTGLWRYRVGDYRIVCQIEEQTISVLVIHIGHRKNVYKWRPPKT